MEMREFRIVMKSLREQKLLSDEGLKFWEWIEFFDKVEEELKKLEKRDRIERTVEEIAEILRELPEDEKRSVIEDLAT